MMDSKNYTVENFEMESVLKEDTGSWNNKNPYYYGVSKEGKFSINYSDILTFLIQVAGKICKYYASDLFITWSSLEEKLKDVEYTGGKILFGFRESGVDSNAFVLSRLNNYGKEQMEKDIKELYLLEVKVDKSYGEISGSLERMDISMKFGRATQNPFENPEAWMVCMIIEGCANLIGQCKCVEEIWNDEVELTEELAEQIKEEIKGLSINF